MSLGRRTLLRRRRAAGLPVPREWIGLARALRAHRAILRGGSLKDAALAGGYSDQFVMFWRLIGARRGTCTIDGEKREGVWHAGLFYTRRELPVQERKKLERAVKYIRCARITDPPEVVEDGGGDLRYVTLAVFRGDGRRRDEYALPLENAA